MNRDVQETYLGWNELSHKRDCVRPAWTVDVREEEKYRPAWQGAVHGHFCPEEDCEHGILYTRVTVRAVCLSCHIAHLISGESETRHSTTTRTTGYGETPRKTGGLYLWPGELWFDDEPHEWLVSREKAARLSAENILGGVYEERGPRGGRTFSATARPSPTGEYGVGRRLRWERAQRGLSSPAAAAKWIVEQYDGGGAA
ncbi:hypothetical protein ABZX85_35930 [Streptomyces sp. NPDC004539]|uniref:hypothetical protein n=1 Tax=Streptomyces sp. NPDC004539 TaxID=3154280 RepID=UPI0033BA0983